ncbi:MAG TPA: GNAT family N-acetyltransferase [Paucimonas sp.]|nr:GNAT family N-acetyltransferase [Paucimonas sp.]
MRETAALEIEITGEKKPELVNALIDGVRAYNNAVAGETQSQPLSAFAWENGELIGGVSGRTIYGHFLIEVVWVHEKKRRTGLGRRLMLAAETEAKKRGCAAAQVDTLSFQGIDFYPRLGFEIVGKIAGFPPGHDRYFMLKRYA